VSCAGLCRSRWADELWRQHCGCVASSRLLYRPPPPRCQARRLASCAIEQVRTGRQCPDRNDARPQRAPGAARHRRRGDRMSSRRKFITLLGGAAAAWPLAARAQRDERMRRIGVLVGTAADDAIGLARIAAFLQGLGQLDWMVGRNVRMDVRWAAADANHARGYAAELVALAPDVIVASSGSVVGPLRRLTSTIPIVFTETSDPVGA